MSGDLLRPAGVLPPHSVPFRSALAGRTVRHDEVPDGLICTRGQNASRQQLVLCRIRSALQNAPYVNVAHSWELSQLSCGRGIQIQRIRCGSSFAGSGHRCRLPNRPWPASGHPRRKPGNSRKHQNHGHQGQLASHRPTIPPAFATRHSTSACQDDPFGYRLRAFAIRGFNYAAWLPAFSSPLLYNNRLRAESSEPYAAGQ